MDVDVDVWEWTYLVVDQLKVDKKAINPPGSALKY